MKDKIYKSPKVDFQEMKLLERVADTCWGYAYAWCDVDKNGVIEGAERIDLVDLGLGSNGCQGNAAKNALKDYFSKYFGFIPSDNDVSPNTHSKLINVPKS